MIQSSRSTTVSCQTATVGSGRCWGLMEALFNVAMYTDGAGNPEYIVRFGCRGCGSTVDIVSRESV